MSGWGSVWFLGGFWAVLGGLWAVLGPSWAVLGRMRCSMIDDRGRRLMNDDRRPMVDEVINEGIDEMSMSVSRDNDTAIDLQGQGECHQRGQRAKHKHPNPKEEETLHKKISNSRSIALGGCYVELSICSPFSVFWSYVDNMKF